VIKRQPTRSLQRRINWMRAWFPDYRSLNPVAFAGHES
jgi:hypothetical protein